MIDWLRSAVRSNTPRSNTPRSDTQTDSFSEGIIGAEGQMSINKHKPEVNNTIQIPKFTYARLMEGMPLRSALDITYMYATEEQDLELLQWSNSAIEEINCGRSKVV